MFSLSLGRFKKRKHAKGPSPGMFLILFLTITIMLSGCNAVNPQTGSLEGVVHRETSADSVPVKDALISISGSTQTALTNEGGYFLLSEISAGKRTLTIVKEGYITTKFLNVLIEPDVINEVNLGEPIILNPTEDRFLYDSAMDSYEQGNYQQSMNLFQELRNTFPDSPWADDAQYYIGFINESKFHLYIQAILSYYGVLLDYPDSPWADDAQLGIGNCYYATKDYGNAIKEYRKVLDFYPGSDLHPVAQYSIAQSYRKAEIYNDAIIEFQMVINLYPESTYAPPSQYFIGECYYSLQQYNQAIVGFHKVINNYPQSSWPQEDRLIAPAAYFYIGYCNEKLENWMEALIAYQTIIDFYPKGKWDDGTSIAADAQTRIDFINEHYFLPEE